MFDFTDEIRANMRTLASVVAEVRKHDPQMELQQFLAFLLIASRAGASVPSIQRELGVARSSATRIMRYLGRDTRGVGKVGKTGLGLVTLFPNSDDPRANDASLTSPGYRLCNTLSSLMSKGSNNNGTEAWQ